ncbi:GNAT family N-acetyltransferase [Kribbella sp. CA-294648]|uniref:GNAT family N-acetyltransferase n=1 Tax=Kribbella sp. CA-294648 TaxID=3239948 RepID=UPI003D94C462
MTAAAVLPDGFRVRAPETTDAEGIFDLISAYNTTVVGFADCTLDEVAEKIVEPGFGRSTDGFLVLGRDDAPVGYGTAFAKGKHAFVEIEVTSPEPSVAAWLYERTMRRATAMGRAEGHAEITVDVWVHHDDEPLRALLSGNEFALGTTYFRMRIDHAGPVAAPALPAGLTIRRGAFDDASRWTAHEVILAAFHGQFGFVPRPHDEWVQALEAKSTFAWSQLTLLEIEGRAVAFRTCGDEFIEGDNCGHLAGLGVVEEFRGRGLATFLLRDSFALDAAAGRAGTILHVDTNNPSKALRLYESVGMAPTLVMDGLRRTLSTS